MRRWSWHVVRTRDNLQVQDRGLGLQLVSRFGKQLRFVAGEACQAERQHGRVGCMRLGGAGGAASPHAGLEDFARTWLVAVGIVARWDLDGRRVGDRSCLATEGIAAWVL
jgi:hypothetical protein